jgi:hypothetical protein
VINPSSAGFSSWSVLIDTNQAVPYTTWNGLFSSSSGIVSVAPAFTWNLQLAPNETDSSIGFCANRDVPGSGTLPVVLSTAAN